MKIYHDMTYHCAAGEGNALFVHEDMEPFVDFESAKVFQLSPTEHQDTRDTPGTFSSHSMTASKETEGSVSPHRS